MSNFLTNLFNPHKNKNNCEKSDDQSKKKDNNQNQNEEDLPPVVIPRRFSLSKSGRIKEKKRSKLGIYNASKADTVMDNAAQKSEPNSKSASKESLDKTEGKS